MKAILLVDEKLTLLEWQSQALDLAAKSGLEISGILQCSNPLYKKDFKKFLYYIFALVSRRRIRSCSKINIQDSQWHKVPVFPFNAETQGIWQSIPEEVFAQLEPSEVLIKFGMNLLSKVETIPTKYGVLSYHHGDPEEYRGRPAGFYEILRNATKIGIIVQQLNSTLDGGRILSRSYAKVFKHSYALTLERAFHNGIPLLAQALSSLVSQTSVETTKQGPIYRLPTNRSVIYLSVKIAIAKVERILYGAFVEKRWNVGFVKASGILTADNQIPEPFTILPIPKDATFVADPVGAYQGGILCELLDSRSGKGRIGFWDGNIWRRIELPFGSNHISYPQVLATDSGDYLFPEISKAQGPTLLKIKSLESSDFEAISLQGLENQRILDGTLFEHQGYWYLFGGNPESSADILRLWVSDDLFGIFREHPSSPIAIDPEFARMAGQIHKQDGKIFRFAQDCSVIYGGKVSTQEIEDLTPTSYKEKRVGSLEVSVGKGPHTILFNNGKMYFDYFTEKFTPLAGVRRLLAKL